MHIGSYNINIDTSFVLSKSSLSTSLFGGIACRNTRVVYTFNVRLNKNPIGASSKHTSGDRKNNARHLMLQIEVGKEQLLSDPVVESWTTTIVYVFHAKQTNALMYTMYKYMSKKPNYRGTRVFANKCICTSKYFSLQTYRFEVLQCCGLTSVSNHHK